MQVKDRVERGDGRRGVQLRSAGLLALLLMGLGIAAAAVVGLVTLGLAALIDQALG